MIFRKTVIDDLKTVMKIIEDGKNQLKKLEINQWQNGYPDEKDILKDIENNESYVVEISGRIAGTAVISFKKEKNYEKIEKGKWLTNEKYCVIHRIAVDKDMKNKNIATEIFKYAEKICVEKNINSIKIDTHEENEPMKSFLIKNGFICCGIIYLETGEKRLAFEKVFNKK